MQDGYFSGNGFNRKYFEGYRRAITLDEQGKMHVEFVYEGIYYSLKDESLSRRNKICCIVFPTASLLCLVYSMSKNIPYNLTSAVTILQVCLMLLLGCNTVCGIIKAMTKKQLIRWEYRMGYVSIRELTALCILLTVALTVILTIRLIAAYDVLRLDSITVAVCCVIIIIMQNIQLQFVNSEAYTEEESTDILDGIDVTNDVTAGCGNDYDCWR